MCIRDSGNGSRKPFWGSLDNFLAWARKLLQEASLGLSGTVFWSGVGNGFRKPLWGSLGTFSGL
eukprot:10882018-Karenia_brevis.AAC.1